MLTYGDLVDMLLAVNFDIELRGATPEFLTELGLRMEALGTAIRVEGSFKAAEAVRPSELPREEALGPMVTNHYLEIRKWLEGVAKAPSANQKAGTA